MIDLFFAPPPHVCSIQTNFNTKSKTTSAQRLLRSSRNLFIYLFASFFCFGSGRFVFGGFGFRLFCWFFFCSRKNSEFCREYLFEYLLLGAASFDVFLVRRTRYLSDYLFDLFFLLLFFSSIVSTSVIFWVSFFHRHFLWRHLFSIFFFFLRCPTYEKRTRVSRPTSNRLLNRLFFQVNRSFFLYRYLWFWMTYSGTSNVRLSEDWFLALLLLLWLLWLLFYRKRMNWFFFIIFFGRVRGGDPRRVRAAAAGRRWGAAGRRAAAAGAGSSDVRLFLTYFLTFFLTFLLSYSEVDLDFFALSCLFVFFSFCFFFGFTT